MSKQKPFSFTKCYSLTFEDEASQIEAWFSNFSGLEKVYVNGELVSSQRTLSKDSTNTFKIGENEYSTNLHTASLFKGPSICTLCKNGNVYRRQKLRFPSSDGKKFKSQFLSYFIFFFVMGIVVSVTRAYWGIRKEYMYLFLFIIFILATLYSQKTNPRLDPIIEEENIN
jgi:hypothetical protein